MLTCVFRSRSGSLEAMRLAFVPHSNRPFGRLAACCRRLALRRRAQDDACRWIDQMGPFARSADDGLISMGIHGHILGGKTLNAKAGVRAAVEEKRHGITISAALVAGIDLAQEDGSRPPWQQSVRRCGYLQRAAGYLLALAARRGRQDYFGLSSGVYDTISLIERMRGPGLALTPTAVAGMDNQWRSDQTIPNLPARASAFHVRSIEDVVDVVHLLSALAWTVSRAPTGTRPKS